jgi:anti-sigma B factor antagonist
MTITERAVDGVRVLDVQGPIALGTGGADLLADKVRSLLQQGEKRLVMNLAAVPYIDSAALGELVRAHATAARQGGSLKLLNVTKKLQDLLVITKLATVFELFDSEQAAVSSFQSLT